MRHLYALVMPFLLARTTDAQTPKGPHWIVSTGFRSLFLPHPGFVQGFDYSYNSNGQYGQFIGTLPHPIPTSIYGYDFPTVEAVFNHGEIALGAGLENDLGNDHNFCLKLGYRYILRVNDIQIEPGFNFYDLIGKNKPLGNIDNRGVEIDILGFQAIPSWSTTTTDEDGNTSTDTYYADHLDVDLNRSALIFNPVLTLSVNPAGRLFFRIEAGYSVQIDQTSKVNFVQRDTRDIGHKIGEYHLDNIGSFSGPSVGFSLGFALAAWATPRRAIHLF